MNKVLKVFLWIFLFPFMLTYWSWKNKNKPVIAIGIVLSILFITTGVPTPKTEDISKPNIKTNERLNEETEVKETQEDTSSNEGTEEASPNNEDNDLFEGYRLIEVDGGDQSGYREANVVVDIGFGDREYYAFTNEYGQLVKVIAKEIILQDETKEPVLSTGRYYSDEAKVPGVESPNLDEGHVIADSLGGVSNAYNITPQNSTLNRHGDQAYMEKAIREAGGCTDFIAIISYPNTDTQIPSHYSYTYTINEKTIRDEFDNVNPDEVNAQLETKEPTSMNEGLVITELDKEAEYIVIENKGNESVNLKGYKIVSVTGNQTFIFSEFVLEPNEKVKVGDSSKNLDVNFNWVEGNGIWNNSKSDPAELYNSKGELVHKYNEK